MGFGKVSSPIVPISSGGTGAITVADAKTALQLANLTTLPFVVTASTTGKLTFRKGSDYILFINGNNEIRRGMYMGGSNGSGVVNVSTIWEGADSVVTVRIDPSDTHVIDIINNGTVGIFGLLIQHNSMDTSTLPIFST